MRRAGPMCHSSRGMIILTELGVERMTVRPRDRQTRTRHLSHNSQTKKDRDGQDHRTRIGNV